MRKFTTAVLATASLLPLAAPAFAQEASAEDSAISGDEIIVQARRKDESIQDVPLSMQAVTGQDLQKLEIRQFEDVARAVPGLQLAKAGSVASSSMRGVSFNAAASGAATSVEFYRNDAVITQNALFQAVYDIGQIEVLRGPQGTLRGRAAPSGSITVTTRRPDLSEVGGYVSATGASRGKWNFNAALNVPVIADKLAVRIAGFMGDNRNNNVFGRNLLSGATDRDVFEKTRAIRASVRADPFDGVLVLDYNFESIQTSGRRYTQVESRSSFNGALPASPVFIRPEDRLGIGAFAAPNEDRIKLHNWQAMLRLGGQRLTYVGAHSSLKLESIGTNDNAGLLGSPFAVNGPNNFGPTNVFGQYTLTRVKQTSHELRLQNEDRIAGLFDYVVGAFRVDNESPTLLSNPNNSTINRTSLNGTGPTFADATQYVLNSFSISGTGRARKEQETSLFANLTLHLGENTEISGGLRHIWIKTNSFALSGSPAGPLAPAFGTAQNPTSPLEGTGGSLLLGRCNGFSAPLYKPGVVACTPAREATIYTASIKHNLTPDHMAYFSFGTSYRPGNSVVGYGLGADPAPVVGPFLRQFLDLPDETSKSFEIGFKTAWLDRRLRFNISAFYQKFNNFPVSGAGIATVEVPTTGANAGVARLVTAPAIASPVDMSVKGLEADITFDVSPNFNISANVAFANSKVSSGRQACVDLNNDNITDVFTPADPLTAQKLLDDVGANQIDTCLINGQSANNQPRWSGSAQAEYSHPVGFGDAFLRGFVSWKGDSAGDPVNPSDGFSAYALFDLYGGVRDPKGGWELNAYVKNLFDTKRVLTRGASGLSTAFTQTSSINTTNYLSISTLDPREVGVSLRFSFGSR